ncbi:MAG: hypothetical protein ACYTHM_05510 [Planctomycetota bacterium]|jgi:tetratricopeptide (TPR) repeat protein
MAGILARLKAAWRCRRAESALLQGRFQAAADLFGEGMALSDTPSVRIKRGYALWAGGNRKDGEAEAEAGAKSLPDHHPARLYHALILIAENRFDKGEKIIASILERDKENLFAHGLSALRLLFTGEMEKARSHLAKGLFASPLLRAHLLLGLESHLEKSLRKEDWTEKYLEMVL